VDRQTDTVFQYYANNSCLEVQHVHNMYLNISSAVPTQIVGKRPIGSAVTVSPQDVSVSFSSESPVGGSIYANILSDGILVGMAVDPKQ
jgi:hypothetical protein